MKSLEHPNNLHLRAAQGWLELGNAAEAHEELRRIAEGQRRHPDVQEVLWQILAQEKKWEGCVRVANAIIRTAPERPFGHIHLSYALHELRLTEDAYENLLGVVDNFPEEAVLRYNLACYSCQLGYREEAKEWLRQAVQTGDARDILRLAAQDEDLRPLWKEIGRL